jgi:hypothetical protein
VLFAFATPVAGAVARPDYSHVAQFISELGETGAVHGPWISGAGFAPTGLLVLLFLGLARPAFPISRRSHWGVAAFACVGLGYVVGAIARCDVGCPATGSVSQSLHNQFGVLQYVGAAAGLVLLKGTFERSERWRRLAPACTACAALVATGFVALLVPDLAPIRGLSQRVAEVGIFLWIAVVSLELARTNRSR